MGSSDFQRIHVTILYINSLTVTFFHLLKCFGVRFKILDCIVRFMTLSQLLLLYVYTEHKINPEMKNNFLSMLIYCIIFITLHLLRTIHSFVFHSFIQFQWHSSFVFFRIYSRLWRLRKKTYLSLRDFQPFSEWKKMVEIKISCM